MTSQRLFPSKQYFLAADDEPIRSVVTTSAEAVVVAWYVRSGQSIRPHRHPGGQDTWTLLAGEGDYVCNEKGDTFKIRAGDIVVAHTGEVHGLHNKSADPIYFISVVTPSDAGFELLSADGRPPA